MTRLCQSVRLSKLEYTEDRAAGVSSKQQSSVLVVQERCSRSSVGTSIFLFGTPLLYVRIRAYLRIFVVKYPVSALDTVEIYSLG